MINLEIIGNLGKDAEVKTIGGREVLTFSVASTYKEQTTWVDVVYTPLGLQPWLLRGATVFARGRVSIKNYEGANGLKISLSIWADTVQLCGGVKKKEVEQENNDLPW